MKKLLFAFVVLDFLFLGSIWFSNSEDSRQIASTGISTLTGELDGKAQKLNLIKSLQFNVTDLSIELRIPDLPEICADKTIVVLNFKAIDVAFAGENPQIKHSFSCKSIVDKPNNFEALTTEKKDLYNMHKQNLLKLSNSDLRATGLYEDEEMPAKWKLFEVQFSGETSFTITEAEFNTYIGAETLHFQIY